jgi:hypothetical protein
MKVEMSRVYPAASQRSPVPTPSGAADFASMLSARTPEMRDASSSTSGGQGPDFTSMTRQELFDWMNDRIRNSDMSLDESSPFLGMTVRISVATGEPVDMTTDTTRFDFTERARQGIEYALAHLDLAAAGRMQDALDRMLRARNGAF